MIVISNEIYLPACHRLGPFILNNRNEGLEINIFFPLWSKLPSLCSVTDPAESRLPELIWGYHDGLYDFTLL